ncbi:MAG: YncE family protein [Actinomycetales bacterium]|nr:YncE family protein [Actinomycetales bacterium]
MQQRAHPRRTAVAAMALATGLASLAGIAAFPAVAEPAAFGTVTQRIAIEPDSAASVLSRDGTTIFVIEPSEVRSVAGKVRVIDVASGSILEEITVGKGPRDAVLSERGNHLYVLNAFSKSVSIVNTNDLSVTRTVRLAYPPRNGVISADGNRLYVQVADSQLASSRIAVIDTRAPRVLRTLRVTDAAGKGCEFPRTPALTGSNVLMIPCNRDLVYVSASTGRTLGRNAGLCDAISTPVLIRGNTQAYVPCGQESWFVDPAARAPISSVRTFEAGEGSVAQFMPPPPPAVSPDQSKIYQPVEASGKLAVIDAAARTLVAKVAITGSLGLTSSRPAISSDGARLYIGLLDAAGTLVDFNAQTNTVIGQIPLGANTPEPGNPMIIDGGAQIAVPLSIGELVKVTLLPR